MPPKSGARSRDLDEAKKEARIIQLCLLDKGIRELGVVWEFSEADIYNGRRTSGKNEISTRATSCYEVFRRAH
jgi:hypothetical protein